MDLNLVCRLCAKEDTLCIQVFGTEGVKQHVAKKIRLCLPIIVKESDDFPKQICLNCLSNLDTSYELYTRCMEAQSVIKNLVLVNKQCQGEMVRVYSTQEMLKMVNELRDKICDKRPSIRLGNTVYSFQDSNSQTEETPSDEQRAKKRKQESKTGSKGVMYPVMGTAGSVGQQYMLMPSAPMPQAVLIPSSVPQGQFAIQHLPAIQPFSIPQMPTVAQIPSSQAPVSAVQATNIADVKHLAQLSVPQTTLMSKVTQTNTSVQVSSCGATQTSAPQIAAVQGTIQQISALPVIQSTISVPKAAAAVHQIPHTQNVPTQTNASQQTTTPKIASVQGSVSIPIPRITSIQSAVQTFKDTPVTQTRIASVQTVPPPQIASAPSVHIAAKTLQPAIATVSTPLIASVQGSVKAFEQITVPEISAVQGTVSSIKATPLNKTKQLMGIQPLESTSSSMLESIISDTLDSADPLNPSENNSQQSSQNIQSEELKEQEDLKPDTSVMVNVDEDEDEYAADDPDPLQNDSAEEEQEIEESKTEIEESKTEIVESFSELTSDTVNENRVPSSLESEEMNISGDQQNTGNGHVCPYCLKSFPDDVILHHKKLHFRQKFFSCITCNKNFRTERGLESHRCD